MTLYYDRWYYPQLLTLKMYEDSTIQCTIIGCKQKFSIDEMNNHEFSTASTESFNDWWKAATTKTIPIKCSSTLFSAHFFNFTAQCAIERTAPKYSSITLRSCSNPAYWICSRFACRSSRVAELPQR